MVMSRKKALSYSDALCTPISLSVVLRNAQSDEDPIRDEVMKKFVLLIAHYNINPNLPPPQIWYELAVNLAFEHVRGFQFAKPRRSGRKKRWVLKEAQELVAAIDSKKSTKGIKTAIRSAMKQKDLEMGRYDWIN